MLSTGEFFEGLWVGFMILVGIVLLLSKLHN
jgi:hypothetical protein